MGINCSIIFSDCRNPENIDKLKSDGFELKKIAEFNRYMEANIQNPISFYVVKLNNQNCGLSYENH